MVGLFGIMNIVIWKNYFFFWFIRRYVDFLFFSEKDWEEKIIIKINLYLFLINY